MDRVFSWIRTGNIFFLRSSQGGVLQWVPQTDRTWPNLCIKTTEENPPKCWFSTKSCQDLVVVGWPRRKKSLICFARHPGNSAVLSWTWNFPTWIHAYDITFNLPLVVFHKLENGWTFRQNPWCFIQPPQFSSVSFLCRTNQSCNIAGKSGTISTDHSMMVIDAKSAPE